MNNAVAVVYVPNLAFLVFRLGFPIYPFFGRKELAKVSWVAGTYTEFQGNLEREGFDRTSRLLDILFSSSIVTGVDLENKEFVIHVYSGADPRNAINYVIGAIGEAYLKSVIIEVIRAKRIFIKGLSFDIPLGSEITIGEPKPKPYAGDMPLVITL